MNTQSATAAGASSSFQPSRHRRPSSHAVHAAVNTPANATVAISTPSSATLEVCHTSLPPVTMPTIHSAPQATPYGAKNHSDRSVLFPQPAPSGDFFRSAANHSVSSHDATPRYTTPANATDAYIAPPPSSVPP